MVLAVLGVFHIVSIFVRQYTLAHLLAQGRELKWFQVLFVWTFVVPVAYGVLGRCLHTAWLLAGRKCVDLTQTSGRGVRSQVPLAVCVVPLDRALMLIRENLCLSQVPVVLPH